MSASISGPWIQSHGIYRIDVIYVSYEDGKTAGMIWQNQLQFTTGFSWQRWHHTRCCWVGPAPWPSPFACWMMRNRGLGGWWVNTGGKGIGVPRCWDDDFFRYVLGPRRCWGFVLPPLCQWKGLNIYIYVYKMYLIDLPGGDCNPEY